MKLKFNESDKTIEIKDGIKTQFFLVKTTLLFTVLNSVLFPVFVLNNKQFESFGFIWIILGISSITLLIYQFLKKSTSEKLKLSEISAFTERQILGRNRFSLKLKNGKLRDLGAMRNQSDISETKKFFRNIGVEMNQTE